MKAQTPIVVFVLANVLIATCVEAAIYFPNIPPAVTEEEKHSVMSIHHAIVGRGITLKPNVAARASRMVGGFQLLTRTAMLGGPGAVVDVNGQPVMSFALNYAKGSTPETSVNPDYTTLLPRQGDPTKADLFVHFESPNPASVYHLELDVGPDGQLAVRSQAPVDFSAWGGVWTPCAGSMSPWGTHLGSEEYEPDARTFYSSNSSASRVREFARYFGLYQGDFNGSATFMERVREVMSPYRYGFVTEVSYDVARGTPVARKWYSLGRVSVEAALVMPDKKTVYITDDGRNVGFFKFVASRPGDFRRGRLYAAKFTQISATKGGNFTVSWVDLGSTDQDLLAAAIPGLRFSDIFEYAAPVAGSCAAAGAGFRPVKHSYGEECLRLRSGAEKLAAAFETRRYAAYLGATTEWSKWEGITLDATRRKIYTSITDVNDGCLPEPTRFGGQDDVRLPSNKCGCVYSLDLDSSYSATYMYGLTCGMPDVGGTPGLTYNNTCHLDRIASPDNVAYVPGLDLLLIAEDTDYHDNNFLWALDVSSGDMTRVLAAPVGAEVTGIGFFTLPNGLSYIWSNIQHPDASGVMAGSAGDPGRGGYVGYFGPFRLGKGEALGLQAIPAPVETTSKLVVTSSAKAVIGKYVPASYTILARSGQRFGDTVWGANLNSALQPVATITSNWQLLRNKSEISNSPDFSSLTAVCDKTFFSTHFEYANPAAMYTQVLAQEPTTGRLSATSDAAFVDWSAWGGLLTPCAGSITPWGTRLGSEEYEPDARAFANAKTVEDIGGGPTAAQFTYDGGNALKMGRLYDLYYGEMNLTEFKAAVKPYLYGYITEAKIQYDNSAVVQKHYTLGRVATELGLVMPDKRTVYITDDGSNVGFFKFVADRPGDLTAGNLYAAKATQISGSGGGTFRISWIWLAYGTQDQLVAAASVVQFPDVFDAELPANGSCLTPGFRAINAGGRGCECLRLRPGSEVFAAFFETRRYAAYLGATTEWSKWEGITLDAARRKIYTSITDVRQGMEDFKDRGASSSKFDMCGSNDVRLEYNRCGCVYSLSLDGSFSAYWMEELVCGTPATNPAAPGYVAGNRCLMDRIANPDNVAYSPEHDLLVIGEDTSEHVNDVMWAYDIETRALTRIFSTPYGSETTSAYWYGNINGFAYIAATVQHPYGESDTDKVNDPLSFGLGGASGVIGPLPAVAAPGSPTSPSRSTGLKCASMDTYVVEVQVTYQSAAVSSPADAARLDAYVCARVDNMLVRLSGAVDDASRVAVRCVTGKGDTGNSTSLQRNAVLARVQLGPSAAEARVFQQKASDPSGDLRSELAALFAALSTAPGGGAAGAPTAAAFPGFSVQIAQPRFVRRSEAYTPPAGVSSWD
ncbi:alkaline phosphatase, secreted, phosphate-repressible [Volvox carteri f. nagariensis]|uniref:Alkaline phosphatase, secreted, phosphate-repressible n=1 Tax=Volvox carteri f. nagariensis TaxID=3068 RepID=D8TXF6_VOLCA|nr:alkaline phosphatase, secreted, phosphate-repressible [Volvox carteri f. nagariensis]EFJ47998.1 alkaline phosphatase, secreted, phosphate-repressible [Volvox carteri f. nagariensis]|eukprot:XP_002951104.1 alkaline phosphatase, secreted, phosphate-repressible [Volvox carteri f. nagariensis]